MSTSVDRRVVSMEFDNKDFERNIEQSRQSLDRFNKSLDSLSNNDVSALKQATQDFASGTSGIAAAVDKASSAFSTIKREFFKDIYHGITDSLKSTVDNSIGYISDAIIEGGKKRSLNLQQARFTMKGVLSTMMDAEAAAEKTEAIISGPVNESVTDTAYGLDEAAVVASNLVASGITDLERLEKTLLGVSGTAAMTGSDFASIGHVFTKVAGQGRVLGSNLLELSNRGVNAAATIAQYVNKIGADEAKQLYGFYDYDEDGAITERDVRDFITNAKDTGGLAADLFFDAMSESFAEHAKEGNKLFSGALSNFRAAWARIGAEFWGTESEGKGIINNARDMLNAVRPAVNLLKKAMTEAGSFESVLVPMLNLTHRVEEIFSKFDEKSEFFDPEKYATLKAVITNLTMAFNYAQANIEQFAGILRDAWQYVFPEGIGLNFSSIAEAIRKFVSNLYLSEVGADKLRRTFAGFFSLINIVKKALGKLWDFIKPIFGVGGGFLEGITEIIARIGDLFVSLDQGVGISESFYSIWEKIGDTFKNVKEWIGNASFEDAFKWLRVSYIEGGGGLPGVLEIIFDLLKEIVVKFSELISMITGVDFTGVGEGIGTIIQKIRNSVVDFIWDFQDAIGIGGYVDEFGNSMMNMSDRAVYFKDRLAELRQNVLDFAGTIADKFRSVKDAFGSIFGNKQVTTSNGVEYGVVTLEEYGDAFNDLGYSFGTLEKGVKESKGVGGIFGAIGTFFSGLQESTKNINPGIIMLMSLAAVLTYFVQTLGALFQAMANGNGIFGQFKKKFFIVMTDMQIAFRTFSASTVLNAIKGLLLAVAILGGVVAGLAVLQHNNVDIDGAILTLGKIMLMTVAFAAFMAFIASRFNNSMLVEGATLGDKAIQVVSSWLKFGSLTSMVLKMSASMILIARALQMVAEIPTDKLLIAGAVMATLLLIISIIVIGMDYLSDKIENVWKKRRFQSTAAKIFAIAASFLMMAIAIKMINDMSIEDWKDFLTKILTVVGTLTILYLAIRASDSNFIGDDPVEGFAKLLFAIGGSFMLIALALKMIGNMSEEEWEQGSGGILLISAFLVGIIFELGLLQDRITKSGNVVNSGSMWSHMAKMVLAVAASMILVAIAFKSLTTTIHKYIKKNETSTLIWAIGILAGMFIAIGALIYIAEKYMTNDLTKDPIKAVGTMMLKIAASIILIAFAFSMLSMTIHSVLKDEKNGREALVWTAGIIFGLVILMGLFAVAAAAMDKNNWALTSVAGTILALGGTVAILAIVISLMAIAFNDLEKRKNLFLSFIVVIMLMVGMAGAMAILGNTAANISWSTVMAMIVMSATAIAGLYFLKDIPFWAMVAGAVGMGLVFAALILAAKGLSKIQTYSWAGLGAIATILGAMLGLAGIIILIDKNTDANNLPKIAIGMAMMVGVLALAVAGFAAAAPVLDSLSPVLLIAIAIIALVEAALAGLAGIILLFANAIKTFAEAALIGIQALHELLTALMELGNWFRAQGKQGIIEIMQAFHQFAIMLAVTLVEAFTTFAVESAAKAPIIVAAWLIAIQGILTLLNQAVPVIVGLVADIISNALIELSAHVDEFAAAAALLMMSFLEAFFTFKITIIEEAVNFIIEFINTMAITIEEKTDELATAIETLVQAIINAGLRVILGKENYEKYKKAGRFLILGARDGITDGEGSLKNALTKVASNANDAMADEWEEHSPSKKGFARGFMYMVGAVLGATEGGEILKDKVKQTAIDSNELFGEYLSVEEGQVKLEEFFGLFGGTGKKNTKSFSQMAKTIDDSDDKLKTLTKDQKKFTKSTKDSSKAMIDSDLLKRQEGETAEEWRERIQAYMDAGYEIDYSYKKQTDSAKSNTKAVNENTEALDNNINSLQDLEDLKEEAEKSSKKSKSTKDSSTSKKKSDQGESDYAYLSPAGFKHSKEELDLIQQAQQDLKLSSDDWNKIEQYTLKMIQAGMYTEEINANLQSLAERISDANAEGRDFSEILEGISINLNAERLSEAGYVDLVTESWERQTEALEKNADAIDKNSDAVKELQKLQKGGSVDLLNRPVIDASELNKKGWDAGEGSATVFSSTFSNEAGDVAMNFTPIMADENGNYLGALSPEELEKYASEVIEGVREDDLKLKIGATFTGSDAIEKASEAAERIHELHEQYYLSSNSADNATESTKKATEANKQYLKSIDDLSAANITNAYMTNYGRGNNENARILKRIRGIGNLNKPIKDAIDEYDENIDKLLSDKSAYANWVTKYLDLMNEGIKKAKMLSDEELKEIGTNNGDNITDYDIKLLRSIKTWEGSFEDLRKELGLTDDQLIDFFNTIRVIGVDTGQFGQITESFGAIQDILNGKNIKDVKEYYEDTFGDWRYNGKPVGEKYYQEFFGFSNYDEMLKQFIVDYNKGLDNATESTKKATEANKQYSESTLTANQQTKKFYQVLNEQAEKKAAANDDPVLASTDFMKQLSSFGLDQGQMDAVSGMMKDYLGADLMGEDGILNGFASYAQNEIASASEGLNMEIVPSLNLDGISSSLSGMDSTIQMFAQDQAQAIITEMQEFKSGVYHRQAGLHNDLGKIYNIIIQKTSTLVKAIDDISIDPQINVSLGADAGGIFNIVRRENSKRSKALGRNALGGGGSHPF